MSIRTSRAGLGATLVVSASLALAGVSPASADPSSTPDADDIVGVGSDTTEYVLNALANGYNGPSVSAQLVSWNAKAPTPETSWSPRAGAPTATRPNGSGNGKKALYGTGNLSAVNFARSSSALNTAEKEAGLQAFPFAVDGLKLVVSGKVASHAPRDLSEDTLLKIYNGTYKTWNQLPGNAAGSTAYIQPYKPQSGSGTLSFFEAQLSRIKGTAWTTSDYAAASGDYMGVRESQEHDPAPVAENADAIAPFSTARAQTLTNPADLRVEGGFAARRAVYNVVRGTDDSATWVGALFGPAGYICSAAAKPIIEANGFAQLASEANGGVCGVKTQSATSNFTTNTVSTATALSGVSETGGAATLNATVTSGGQVADGEVEFVEGDSVLDTAVLSAGEATAELSDLSPGQHTFVARFVSGNEAAFTSSHSEPVTVMIKSVSTTALDLAPATGTYGHARSAVVDVKAGNQPGEGTVTVKVGSVTLPAATLTAGKATIALPRGLAAGSHAVVATYSGTDLVGRSSATKTLVVAKSRVAVSESFPATVAKRKRATGAVTVVLSPSSTVKPTGAVVVKKGTKVLARGALRNGTLTLRLPALTKGKNTLVASYAGSANTAAASKTFTITQR